MCSFLKDEDLWQEVAKTVRKDKRLAAANKKNPAPVRRRAEVKICEEVCPVLPRLNKDNKRPLTLGNVTSLDRRLAERLRKGKIEAEARLDLHGFTLKEAFVKVRDFILSSYNAKARLVIIVTGKGRMVEDEAGFLHKTGKLRVELPNWLNNPDIRPFILSFTEAVAKDGGGGAFYIYLKKQKK